MKSMVAKTTINLPCKERGKILLALTLEQEERLKGFKLDRAPRLWDIGFATPSQVASYYCKKCAQTYEDTPKVSVSIFMGGGELDTSVAYHCSHCDELIYSDLLSSPKGISEEFIRFDETGDYKRPTIESVNSLLDKLKNKAREGHGDSIDKPCYEPELETAQRWAGKIDYDIKPKVEALAEVFRSSYVARLERELPTMVADIKDKAYGFSLVETDHISPYEGTGLYGLMDSLFEAVKLITLSDPEINKDIFKVFELYWSMGNKEKERLLKEKTDLEGRIAKEEAFLIDARKRQSDFIAKANMTPEQVEEAKENPLDDWPL